MNNIRLKKLTFKNFMSYGNNVNTFTFPEGVVWFTADNGFGKSTIVEALNFALFGNSYRGGNKGDLRNTKNTTCDLEVSVEFDLCHEAKPTDDTDWIQYRIFRTMNPSAKIVFDLEQLVDGKWVKQNKRAGYSQKDFEDNILGFNEVLFKNFIAMNTQETVPFFQMPAAKKRELFQSIIAVNPDFWKKENAKRLSNAKLDFDLANNDVHRLDNEIVEINKIIVSLEQERNENLEQLKADLVQIGVELADLSSQASGHQKTIDSLTKQIDANREKCAGEAALRQELAETKNLETAYQMFVEYERLYEEAKLDADAADYYLANNYKINEWNSERQGIVSELLQLNSSISDLSTKITRMNWDIDAKNGKMAEIVNQGNSFVVGVPCPTCGKPSTEEDVERHKSVLRKQWVDLKNEGVALENERNDLVHQKAQLEESVREKTTKRDELDALIATYHEYERVEVLPRHKVYEQAKKTYDECKSTLENAKVDQVRMVYVYHRIETGLAEIEKLKTENLALSEQRSNASGLLMGVNSQIQTKRQMYSSTEASIAKLEAERENDSLGIAKQRLANAEEERSNAKKRITECSDTIAICNCITDLCSDAGMKKMIFSLFVPEFNQSVQRNILKTNLPFVIKFDDTMDFEFTSAPGLSPNYVMCSQGQKRRIGFAISMAFRDFVSMVGNFKINFLSLDEVLDISTDNNAMRDMLDLVKSMVGDIGCAAVVTHRGEVVADKFDYKVAITYDGSYSRIGSLEKQ